MIYYNSNKIIKAYKGTSVINKMDDYFSGGTEIIIKSPEYISRASNATGYIPLGEYFTSDCVIEIDFQMTQAKGYCIIGDYMNNDNDDWRLFLNFDVQVNNKLNYDFLTDRKQWATSGWGNRFHLEIGNYYVKNLDNGNTVITATSKTFSTRPNQMYLFHFDGYTGSQENLDYGNIYLLKIWKDGVLVKDFIPWTDMQGNYGLYDKISNTVFNSVGQMTGSSIVNDVVVGSGTTSETKAVFQYITDGGEEPTPTEPTDYSREYLTFDIVSGGTIVFKTSNNSQPRTISYSVNNGSTWTDITSSTSGTSFNVSVGDKIMFKGNNTGYTSGPFYNLSANDFSNSTAYFNIEGNIMSLLYGDNFSGQTSIPSNYCFYRFFNGCNVCDASNLVMPATTLASNCYDTMFQGCTSLTTAPELPATTLTYSCYHQMFRACTSLTTAPQLLATTLASSCYNAMLERCTNLNSITCLATDISASGCLSNWVNGVAANGTFTKDALMTSWQSGANGIPNGWTVVDATV